MHSTQNEITKKIELAEMRGLYRPDEERDSCGVGMIASLDGSARRDVVEKSLEALANVWHRGATGADGKSGDGAGLHIEIPQEFFANHLGMMGIDHTGERIGVGMIFLPRTDGESQEKCRTLVEREVIRFGYQVYGWRGVPVDVSVVGESARASRPEIEQLLVKNSKGSSVEDFERDLFLIRRKIEKSVLNAHINEFYICSFSNISVIYKGMILAENLADFYPDLKSEDFKSRFGIFHQRYSTNTFPNWRLAQPFRILAHNGEINTLRGNVNWIRCHEPVMECKELVGEISEILPAIQPGASDSAALDAVCELLLRSGRSLPLCKTLLIPDTWSHRTNVSNRTRSLYEYCNSVMEPWDGPAAIAGFSYPWLLAGMDRNGLRPMRYTITNDRLLIVGSETGMVKVRQSHSVKKGRVGPGEMIGVDIESGKFFDDARLKEDLARSMPFDQWSEQIQKLPESMEEPKREFGQEELKRRQISSGWTHEDLELILRPMIESGAEAVGSMGDDTPLAVLSQNFRGLHHFFRQNFAQVTNPPIDSLRERQVMSLKTRLKNLGNILKDSDAPCRHIQLSSPVLLNEEVIALKSLLGEDRIQLDCTFEKKSGGDLLRGALKSIKDKVALAVDDGARHVFLTDRNLDRNHVGIPMILVVGAVHSHLTQKGLRNRVSINVETADCMDSHAFAVLVGVGATTVNSYLAEESILSICENLQLDPQTALKNFKAAIEKGLLKIMSKLGISVLSSYRGGCNFEALGLSRTLVDEFFPGVPSKISGLGLSGIERKISENHTAGFEASSPIIPIGGFYRFRHGQEEHALGGELIHVLQTAVAKNSYGIFRKYTKLNLQRSPTYLRDLLDFKADSDPIPVEQVESITEIRKRFMTPGMSLGALSTEAHEVLAIAMNRIGARSNSGEGGEQKKRLEPKPNGDNACSSIKQIASGRFGVTAEYLNSCREIEIKVAQGAKPGEGGQLPGFKVTAEIAELRHSMPGVTLISPPPHHDIYSIEDLAQLIYDLKQINPDARVCVKLVARSGIGTIAAGVAKAHADVITVSGHCGGTGASPQTSLKFAGNPWEMGLAEVQQVLTLNGLRERVVLRTDGGLQTGRDIVMAALLGAEEFGIGTASLVAMGCLLVRQCHSNTCPVGICTQDEKLREKFMGTPEKVVNLFSFIAEEVREILASLGAKNLNEVIGRADLLKQVNRGSAYLDDLDLNPLLTRADSGGEPRTCQISGRNQVSHGLDEQLVKDAQAALEKGEKMQLTYNVRNTHRSVGTYFSSMVVRNFGMKTLKSDQVTVQLRGSAGQSLGAFAVQGLTLEVLGDANDYVGKGLSGGCIIVRPAPTVMFETQENSIIGNAVLYGATSGELFAAGQAGDRFAVRNSGATVVVEGCGDNGCEYMTGGTAVILGPVGDNFAAGMTGGMAFVYDVNGDFESRVNPGSVKYQRLASEYWKNHLLEKISRFVDRTESKYGQWILDHFELELKDFWQVVPLEMINRLEQPLGEETQISV